MTTLSKRPCRALRLLPPAVLATLVPMPPVLALLLGAVVGWWCGSTRWARAVSDRALKGSVIALGAGMQLDAVLRIGMEGFWLTLCTLSVTLASGLLLGRLLGVPRHQTILITAGTAICGGSAIAAVAPLLRARTADTGIALLVVFALNALALLLFPSIGEWMRLDAHSFGLWCALAIHDTSSVVGAAASHGVEALEVATAAKLARALWIVPLAFVILRLERTHGDAEGGARVRVPWFILGFLAAAALVTAIPALNVLGQGVAQLARYGLRFALFGIGLCFAGQGTKGLGWRPVLFGLLIWFLLAGLGLVLV